MKQGWIPGILASMLILGCGAESIDLAGGSSEQGNAVHLSFVHPDGTPARGIQVQLHSREWHSGKGNDTRQKSMLTDSSGMISVEPSAGIRLLARSSSLLAWMDLDSVKNSTTLRFSPAARLNGTIANAPAGSFVTIQGTSLSGAVDEQGSFTLEAPALLGKLHLVTPKYTTQLPAITVSAGASITLQPIKADQAADAPALAIGSQYLPVQPNLRTAKVLRSADTSYLRIDPSSWVTLGAILPDSAPQGTVSFDFRPGAAFHRDSAWTLIGDQGGRMHIGFVKGVLFFQKGHDNVHHVITSTRGQFPTDRWYQVSASWGSMGMSLSIDHKPMAWSSDSSFYQRDTRTDTGFLISIGHKEFCCMDALRITRPLKGSGDYANIQFLKSQVDAWGDGKPRSCPETMSTDLLPRCAIQGAVIVTDPLW